MADFDDELLGMRGWQGTYIPQYTPDLVETDRRLRIASVALRRRRHPHAYVPLGPRGERVAPETYEDSAVMIAWIGDHYANADALRLTAAPLARAAAAVEHVLAMIDGAVDVGQLDWDSPSFQLLALLCGIDHGKPAGSLRENQRLALAPARRATTLLVMTTMRQSFKGLPPAWINVVRASVMERRERFGITDDMWSLDALSPIAAWYIVRLLVVLAGREGAGLRRRGAPFSPGLDLDRFLALVPNPPPLGAFDDEYGDFLRLVRLITYFPLETDVHTDPKCNFSALATLGEIGGPAWVVRDRRGYRLGPEVVFAVRGAMGQL